MWITIAGPYRSGEGSPAENLRALNTAALGVFRRGHVPVIGVSAALPVIEAADHDVYDEVMVPLCLALADRCEACLRIGADSSGADLEVQRFRERGPPVYFAVAEVPLASIRSGYIAPDGGCPVRCGTRGGIAPVESGCPARGRKALGAT